MSLLNVPDYVIKEVKRIVYNFLWNGRDRIKRTVLMNSKVNGGLNMISIDDHVKALRATWVTRLLSCNGKWKSILLHYLGKQHLDIRYVLSMSLKDKKYFPQIENIPDFYRDMFVYYNQIKCIKSESLLSDHEYLEQPLFGNELFQVDGKCLFLVNWIKSNILYVKDLVDGNGTIYTDSVLYNKIECKQNIVAEMFIIRKVVMKRLRKCNLMLASGINIKNYVTFVNGNNRFVLKDQKCKFFYQLLTRISVVRSHMEKRWAIRFNIGDNSECWSNIYKQKVISINDRKIAEFNFKLLHNIEPCGYSVSKFKRDISSQCQSCGEVETVEHMLFRCNRISCIWSKIAKCIKCKITWKTLVCGFTIPVKSKNVDCLNMLFSYVLYCIFKQNSKAKFEKKDFGSINVQNFVKIYLIYVKEYLDNTDHDKKYKRLFEKSHQCSVTGPSYTNANANVYFMYILNMK